MTAVAEDVPGHIVLVVESDVLVRLVISEYLRECGYRALEAATGEEALAILTRTELPVDVVFTDARLSGGSDGFTVAQWVRANRPGVDVILVGSVERAADAAAELCDKGPMLSRPYEPQSVVDHIRRLVASRNATEPSRKSGAINGIDFNSCAPTQTLVP